MKKESLAIRWVCTFVIVVLISACSDDSNKRFRLVPSSESNIHFKNELKETLEFNIFNYMYFYNGGGVAVGDVNGDSLLDIYFTSNQDDNKLYLNRGDFKFTDVTAPAGVEGFKGWTTGVTMADVNNDGRLDIYVGNLGDYLIFRGKNQLFINEGNDANGVPVFKDRAREFGLDLVGFATQASFFDYDLDGDLDMFMLNHSIHENGTFGTVKGLRFKSHPLAGDKLMRNDNGVFVEVTKDAGILDNVIGYGLGVVVSDVNLDGWPDIYVGNDFHENDYLYINQKNGTFIESLQEQMNHTSRYTMGVDFADFNNDAFPDLISMDMLPSDPEKLKSSAGEDTYGIMEFKRNYGYNFQYARNTLQLNQHDGTFSEIGLYSGIQATDWSWSTLFADFDLDGAKDIIVSNGILRRSNDLDYINFITVDSVQGKLKFNMTEKELALIEKMPKVKLANFLFQNNHDSTFTDQAAAWGLGQASYSNGTAYADFDNDGDLDLVMNNIGDEAFLYENTTIEKGRNNKSNYLTVQFKGKTGNLFGIGAKVFLYDSGFLQMQECMPTRGYQSSVDYRLNFGLGKVNELDSVKIIWPDGAVEVKRSVKANQWITCNQEEASGHFNYASFHDSRPVLENLSKEVVIPYKHKENVFIEFNRETLMPHMVSAEGPGAVVGDVNGDGLEDVFIGGGKWQPAGLLLQDQGGKFKLSKQKVFLKDSVEEDVDAALADVDGDKDLDLIVISGGNEFSDTSKYLLPRLYLNDGKGNYSRSSTFPRVYLNGSCVSVSDIDKDGDVDLFIGGRSIPWKYGIRPDSYLFENDGRGVFTDITKSKAPALSKIGFVKDAVWTDIDGDKDDDLIIAGEWMPITILRNDQGKLSVMELTNSGLENSHGWWNTIQPGDFDGDGDIDLLAGNYGLNSKLKASLEEPIRMYVKDFDDNGTIEQLVTHYYNGMEYPFCTLDEMTKQMPGLKKRFLSYKTFATTRFSEFIPAAEIKSAELYSVNTLASAYIENLGSGKFKLTPLDPSAQFSPIGTFLVDDITGDGKTDVLAAGNFYRTNSQLGRYDASFGDLMAGDGKGHFKSLAPVQSGLSVKGETRKLVKIAIAGRPCYLAIRNNDTVEVFAIKK